MKSRLFLTPAILSLWAAVVFFAQTTPREFTEFRGTWIADLDEKALIATSTVGLPFARKIIIQTSPVEISVTKDSDPPEIYRVDGTETREKDPATGSLLKRRHSFLLVADALVLTSKFTRGNADQTSTTIITTDAYSIN